jgi:DivIVA domain-containing protein
LKNSLRGIIDVSPKEISEKTFDKTFGFAYRIDAVDEYLKRFPGR